MPHKLLLADDSVTIQRVIELTFADEDVQVIAVSNGQQAIERAQREHPDIVLADVGMPERDGYDVAAFIKGHPQLSNVPVVLLTGAFEPIDESRARAVGCDGVLVKPFEPQMVISRVKDLLAGRKPAGLWGSGPAAQGPVRPAAADPDLRPPAANTGGAADPLEAYFDRLDAAFNATGPGDAAGSTPLAPIDMPPPQPAPAPAPPRREPIPLAATAPPPPAPAARRDAPTDLSSWDPELSAAAAPAAPPPVPQPPRPAPAPVAAAPPAPAPLAAPPPASTSASATPPSLADAFAALLSAEQHVPIAPSAAPARESSGTVAITDDMIDEITRRVVARLSDQARPSVLDVAERIVRQEIERIKQQAR